ncbi:hypothetical protein [Caulobacter sp. Root343]|uniref:hypothetical protein n=1 Tax=Caulobacter sp. Root343 TaxID=1736520 RepID=UPI0006F32736|nr:hypothetical protein [Caulobacter sp. Root343]KQV66650.1 hypothetical protein ASC70_12515 [Caulobacter sp. Root343]
MGLYVGIPGSDYATSPAKQGTQTFPSDDPLPFLALPGLVNWWRGDDAVQLSSVTSVKDRIAGVSLASINSAQSPSLSTVGGKQGLLFAGAQTMSAAASVVKNSAYTWVIVQKAAASLTTGAYILTAGTAPTANWYQWADGHTSARTASGTPGQPASDAGKVIANATQIIGLSFDSTGVKYGFSFDGVFNKSVPITSGQAGAESVATSFNFGASNLLGNPFSGTIFDIFQFDRDYHAAASAAYWAWLVSKLKIRYGIS